MCVCVCVCVCACVYHVAVTPTRAGGEYTYTQRIHIYINACIQLLPRVLPEGWEAKTDEENRLFYENKARSLKQWTFPA